MLGGLELDAMYNNTAEPVEEKKVSKEELIEKIGEVINSLAILLNELQVDEVSDEATDEPIDEATDEPIEELKKEE